MRSATARAAVVYGTLICAMALADAGPAAAAGETRANSFTSGNQEKSAVARLNDGSFVIVWQSSGQDGDDLGIFAQRYLANGKKTGKEFRVNTTTFNAQSAPAIAALANGGFVVVWQSGDPRRQVVRAQRYTAAGVRTGDEIKITDPSQTFAFQPSVAGVKDGGFVVAWTANDRHLTGVYGRRFSAAGAPLGAPFLVNEYTQDSQQRPAVARHKDGFIVLWDSVWQDSGNSSGVYGRLYDVNGTPKPTFRINATIYADQFEPRVGTRSSGDFVVVWTGRDINLTGIYGQRFTATGTETGPEFKVNTQQARTQQNPDIATLGNGDFLVVWTSANQDSSGLGVFGQRFTPAGAKSGREFRVNETVKRDQTAPAVAPWSQKGFVATWDSANQDGSGKGTYTRLYTR